MASMEELIRRVKYLYEVHGADQVAAAQAAITATTGETERATLSLEKGFNNLERKYVETVRAQQNYQKDLEKLNAALAQNPALQQRAAVVMENMTQKYAAALHAAQNYNKATSQGTGEAQLARHELINLSRQIQDVGVGLASGQSPFTILVQQGAQIADIFATSSGTLRGFFSQAVSGAGRFLASTAGMVTAAGAVAVGFTAAAASYSSSQHEVEKALSGIGRASGMTRDQINDIGKASASAFGASISQATEAAAAFVATGNAQKQSAALATQAFDAYVRGGMDASEATKLLAAALQDPVAGVQELNKGIGFLDATTLNYIRSLQEQGKMEEARVAMLKAAIPGIERMAGHVGWLTKAWNAAANALSNYTAGLGQTALSMVGLAPGPDLSAAGQKKDDQTQLKKMSLDADAAARSILGVTAEISKLQTELSKLQQFRMASGGAVTGAEDVGAVKLTELREQEQATIRIARATQEVAAMYPGMTIETAKQLYSLEQQVMVAQSRNVAERMVAQEIATANTLRKQGKSIEEATALAAGQRALQQAQINAQAQLQLTTLQAQLPLIQATNTLEQQKLQHAMLVAQYEDQGIKPAMAKALATQTQVNAQAQLVAQAQQNLAVQQEQLPVIQATTFAEQQSAQWRATVTQLMAQQIPMHIAIADANQREANSAAQVAAAAEKSLVAAQQQLTIAQARTGAEAMVAQEVARTTQLIDQGVEKKLAAKIAATEHATAEANVNKAIEDQIHAMKQELELIEARKRGTEETVKGEQALANAIRQGASARQAAELGAKTTQVEKAKSDEQYAKAAAAGTKAMEAEADAASQQAEQRALANQNAMVASASAYNMQLDQAYEKWVALEEKIGFSAAHSAGMVETANGWVAVMSGAHVKTWERPSGIITQFNPEGYQSTDPEVMRQLIGGQAKFGEGGFTYVPSQAGGGDIVPTTQGITNVINKALGKGGPIQGAISMALGYGDAGLSLAQQLIGVLSEEDKKSGIEQVLAYVKGQPRTIASESLIKQLTDQLKGLTSSTDALNATMQSALSPYYSQDPRTTKLGFRAGVKGNPDWLTAGASNQNPLDAILGAGAIAPSAAGVKLPEGYGQGFASGGSFIVGGGYSARDNRIAAFPVASGEQVVVNRRPQDAAGRATVVHQDNRIIIQGSVDEDTLSKMKVSRYQQSQRMRVCDVGDKWQSTTSAFRSRSSRAQRAGRASRPRSRRRCRGVEQRIAEWDHRTSVNSTSAMRCAARPS